LTGVAVYIYSNYLVDYQGISMAQGGRRPGSGRPRGSMNKRSQQKAEAIEASGLTPLDYMMSVLRNEENTTDVRLEAAKSAAPYVHARLHATEIIASNDEIPCEEELLARIQSLLDGNPELRTLLN
jgi:hypothetical protein